MSHDEAQELMFQRTKFEIDLEHLGTFLADAFIKRFNAFMPADRISILKACHARLTAEGGEIAEHLLTVSSAAPV